MHYTNLAYLRTCSTALIAYCQICGCVGMQRVGAAEAPSCQLPGVEAPEVEEPPLPCCRQRKRLMQRRCS